MNSTRAVVSLVFAGALVLCLRVLVTGSGYATNSNFISVSCSFVVILLLSCLVSLLSYLNSDICTNYLFSVESRLHV